MPASREYTARASPVARSPFRATIPESAPFLAHSRAHPPENVPARSRARSAHVAHRGMAIPEARSPAPEALRNGRDAAQSGRLRRTSRDENSTSSKRDGFPRGFSLGLRPSAERDESGRDIEMDFDTERMGSASPYGSAGAITPEIGSFHLAPENCGPSEESDAEDAFRRPKSPHHAAISGAPKQRRKRDGYITSRLFAKPLAARDEYMSYGSPSPDVRAQATDAGGPMGSFEITFDDVGDPSGWNNVFPRGDRPEPRHFHAAAVVGRRMVVVGGQTASGPCNDVQMLHLGRMAWSELDRGRPSINGQAEALRATTPGPGQLPPCRGHSLVSWGKTVLLVGGEFHPSSERVEVWSFDLETKFWTKIAARGEVPAARSGQSVTRAGSILIMFGGETSRGHKLNDLHILDLKSLKWLPLNTHGFGPSPRSKHIAAMYDDRFLLIFGGASKSKPLGDLFALDFEMMEWSKMKTKGIAPSPRSGHAGILVGDKWYIAGGETRRGSIDTVMLDVGNLTWSSIAATPPNTPVANQGLSLVLLQRKEKTMLVAFGGKGPAMSNQVQVLYILPMDQTKAAHGPLHSQAIIPYTGPTGDGVVSSGGRTLLTPLVEERSSVSRSIRSSPETGNSPLTEIAFDLTGVVPLRRRYGSEPTAAGSNKLSSHAGRQTPGEILSRVLSETPSRDCSPLQQHYKTPDNRPRPLGSSRRKGSFDSTLTSVHESAEFTDLGMALMHTHSNLSARTKSLGSERSASLYSAVQSLRWEGEESSDGQLLADLQDAKTMERRIHLINKYRQNFEMKLSAAVRRGDQAEGRLATVMRGREECERSLRAALKSRQHAEGKLNASLKAQMELKERVLQAERGMDDEKNLLHVVHSENLRLEHDLAFLKAVLEDTQKELLSMREGLAAERARSFQLQMEVFDLKKKMPHSMDEVLANPVAGLHLSPVSEIVPADDVPENACLVAPD